MKDIKIENSEKKVEYIELIYDLIFVYMTGRNNQIIHTFETGFVARGAFMTYVLSTLAIIQIWNFTTFYINMFGRNGVRDHIFLFVNMYLLYFMADATRTNWYDLYYRYNIAWGLILLNLALAYFVKYKKNTIRWCSSPSTLSQETKPTEEPEPEPDTDDDIDI